MKNYATLRDLLVILFKHKYRISFVLLATLITVTVGTMLITPVYEATSTLMIKFGREYVHFEVGESGTPYNYFNRDGIINTEIEILVSRDLQEKCINTMGIEKLYPEIHKKPPQDIPLLEAAVQAFDKNLTVLGNLNSNIIRVSFQHADPEITAKAVNILVDFFQEKHLLTFRDPKTSAFMKEKVAEYGKLLKNSEENLEVFKQKHLAYSLEYQKELLLKQRARLNDSFKKNQSTIVELQEKLTSLESQIKVKSGASTLYSETEIKRKSEVYQEIENNIVLTRASLRSQNAKTPILRRQLKSVGKELSSLTLREQELRDLKRKLTSNEQNYQIYLNKLEEARISDEMDRQKMSNIRIIQPAVIPVKPIKPRKGLNIAIGAVLGLFAGLGIAFFQEYVSQGFNTKESIEKRLGLPVLTAVAYKEKS